jgi:hypothetical protein
MGIHQCRIKSLLGRLLYSCADETRERESGAVFLVLEDLGDARLRCHEQVHIFVFFVARLRREEAA